MAILFEPGKLNYTILSNDTLANPTQAWSTKVGLSARCRAAIVQSLDSAECM